MEQYIDLYEQALEHSQGQATKWFDEVNNLETQLVLAKSQYKHHKEDSERLQLMIAKWKEKVK